MSVCLSGSLQDLRFFVEGGPGTNHSRWYRQMDIAAGGPTVDLAKPSIAPIDLESKSKPSTAPIDWRPFWITYDDGTLMLDEPRSKMLLGTRAFW